MSGATAAALGRVVSGSALAAAEMEAVMEELLDGAASPVHVAALAVALRMRGETVEELGAAARVMVRRAQPIDLGARELLLDTCGTGGDGASTFNISTATAIVVAAAGVPVAKHGNRAVSSRAGSADVLEALGVSLEVTPEEVCASLEALGIAFLFAPAFHGALKHAAPIRRELGLRTFFNLLGPLANPARATHQLLGVYDGARCRQMAEVLGELGVKGAWVVHGAGGLDEVSSSGPTDVAILVEGRVEERRVEPADFGLEPVPIEALRGGDAQQNADILRRVLEGERTPPRTAVLINTAAALVVAGLEGEFEAAVHRAADVIDRGAAVALLDAWVARSGS